MFVEEVFEPLQRADQRRWARTYLNGLLNVTGKKTLQRLAKAASPSSPGAAHGLQQFINASPWDWEPVRQCLARAAAGRGTPKAWTVAELTIPKRGEHSVGVHRRFDEESGRTINCQLAEGLFLSADAYCLPVDWSLILSDSWCDEPRRRRVRIPDSVSSQPGWAHVLDFVETVAAQPHLAAIPWAMDLRRMPEAGLVIAGLARRGLDFVCEVGPGHPVLPAQAGASVVGMSEVMARSQTHQPHLVIRQVPAGRPEPFTVHSGLVRLPVRGGSAEPVSPRAFRTLVRPAVNGRQNPRFWITSFTDRRVEEVLALAQNATVAASAMGDLQAGFGVQDFEGRSFPGWHHHMTMVSAAYAFRRLYGKARGDDFPLDAGAFPETSFA